MKEDMSCGTASCQTELDQKYWQEKWESREIGWDIGYSSPAIEDYLLQYENKATKILIPGCGNAYEAEFLWKQGFRNITILDIAPKAVEILKKKFEDKKEISVICEDFFQHEGNYDLIIEQTFFCAIPTLLRKKYAEKMHEILNENGRIIGVLFNKDFLKKGPPFGGSIPEYQLIFKKYFQILTLENCYNSIEQRKGHELFINLKKK